jgi:hypothetical protein
MWRVIKFLFTGSWKLPCEHNDEIYKEISMKRTSFESQTVRDFTAYHLRCTKCGRLTYEELIGSS